MTATLLLLLLASPLLWLASLFLLRQWCHFRLFFASNLLILAAYLLLIAWFPFGHDEYGLGRLFYSAYALIAHVVLGFGFAVVLRWQQKNAF
ncbi:hypothetical protein [Hymenobacter fastidiosus]